MDSPAQRQSTSATSSIIQLSRVEPFDRAFCVVMISPAQRTKSNLKAPAIAARALRMPQLAAAATQAPAVVPPEARAQTFHQQYPFVKMGLDMSSGDNTWA
jgi:hypothetical protein